ncbi:unnamed protein product, partial [Meganyctiphanes norvegica]
MAVAVTPLSHVTPQVSGSGSKGPSTPSGGHSTTTNIIVNQHNGLTNGNRTAKRAYLEYEELCANSVDLQHTVVPNVFRGQGVAKILAKAALDHFAEDAKKMKLTCWYLQKYYEENPSSKYQGRIIE